MKHIVLTGGGTAGHVTPNIALIPKLRDFLHRFLRRNRKKTDRRTWNPILWNLIRKTETLLRSQKLL